MSLELIIITLISLLLAFKIWELSKWGKLYILKEKIWHENILVLEDCKNLCRDSQEVKIKNILNQYPKTYKDFCNPNPTNKHFDVYCYLMNRIERE